ncbi:hypothetical protein KW846_03655 [Pseudomonas sp. PDM32]|uniref:hypothetical protein n=1 Tax=Pseudomonas sp. PDM32 TaxID=2854768 RepID=UPI001C45AF00|nr:hypothetical protein [Pseudomonas sp. PDM32]MBV7571787.1 hypothetical protein [Pseudomonas sp. PDM32]
MKANEKAKAQKMVSKIQEGTFDENDIDSLFMRLRAYSGAAKVFREAADFVAHNDVRNRGLISDSLEAFFLSFKFYLDYPYQKKPLPIYHPMPLYVKKLMKYQVGKCKPEELRERFNISPDGLRARIDNYFKDDKAKKTTTFQKPIPQDEKSFAPIQHLLSFLGNYPAFSGDELIDDLISVLKSNDLVFDEKAIRAQQSGIIICVMLLMHQTAYDFGGDALGSCQISAENNAVMNGFPLELKENTFGELQVVGNVSCAVPQGNGDVLDLEFQVFKSGLRVLDYCNVSLFTQRPIAEAPEYSRIVVNLDQHLVFTEGGKLGLPDE